LSAGSGAGDAGIREVDRVVSGRGVGQNEGNDELLVARVAHSVSFVCFVVCLVVEDWCIDLRRGKKWRGLWRDVYTFLLKHGYNASRIKILLRQRR